MILRTFKVTYQPSKDFEEPEVATLKANHFTAHFGDATFLRELDGRSLYPFEYFSNVIRIEEVGRPMEPMREPIKVKIPQPEP